MRALGGLRFHCTRSPRAAIWWILTPGGATTARVATAHQPLDVVGPQAGAERLTPADDARLSLEQRAELRVHAERSSFSTSPTATQAREPVEIAYSSSREPGGLQMTVSAGRVRRVELLGVVERGLAVLRGRCG